MQAEQPGRAGKTLNAIHGLTAQDSAERATGTVSAKSMLTAPRETIDQIRLAYRLAKSAEQSRIRLDLGLYAFARVHLTDWQPDAEQVSRAKMAARAKAAVEAIRAGKEQEGVIFSGMAPLIHASEPSRVAFEAERKRHHKAAEKLVSALPGWQGIKHVSGFSAWGLATVIGEAGDLGAYSGCRKLFKRLGLAPDECYETGEKKTGRKIPRNSRGRIMGIIADPLLRAQWRGAREQDDDGSHVKVESHAADDPVVVPAHAIGPFGEVYGSVKARHLAAGKVKGHADKLARRAMVKALLHDVHRAWHGKTLDYATAVDEAA